MPSRGWPTISRQSQRHTQTFLRTCPESFEAVPPSLPHLLKLGEDLLVVGGHGGVGDEQDHQVALLDRLVPVAVVHNPSCQGHKKTPSRPQLPGPETEKRRGDVDQDRLMGTLLVERMPN